MVTVFKFTITILYIMILGISTHAQNHYFIKVSPISIDGSNDFVYYNHSTIYCNSDDWTILKIQKGKLDSLRPIVRTLVLACGGPVCFVRPYEGKSKWQVRANLTLIGYDNGFYGFNSQLTDLAFYDTELQIQSSYPLGFPIHGPEYYAFHNYWSHLPAAILSDTIAFALIPTQQKDVRAENSVAPCPSIAIASLANFPRYLGDTLGMDTVNPFWVGGSFPLPDTGFANNDMMVYFSGIIADTITQSFILWNGGTERITLFSKNGNPKREMGEKGKNLSQFTPNHTGWEKWMNEFPQYVHHWKQPVYGDVSLSSNGTRLFRLYFDAMDPKILENKIPRSQSTQGFFRFSRMRNTYLQVYDYLSGELLEEIALPVGVSRIVGHDKKGRLLLWGTDGWDEKLYFLKEKG